MFLSVVINIFSIEEVCACGFFELYFSQGENSKEWLSCPVTLRQAGHPPWEGKFLIYQGDNNGKARL
jgi:hypothetical protein